MKCPKCGYLGFDDTERCRNCGYDFSLALSDFVPELQLRRGGQTPNPLDDLSLIDAATAPAPSVAMADAMPDVVRTPAGFEASDAGRSGADLPLFGVETPDDRPLITKASPPRPPLAVRRATPEIPRLRGEQPRPQPLDLALDADVLVEREDQVFTPSARARVERWASLPEPVETAAVSARFVAVIIDLAILALIDLVVVYFTMQICGLTIADLAILPKGPLFAFLLVQNGGYLVTFTAGGQTLGKMATGIRVVATESAEPLDVGRAITRTLVWILLAVPAGLGFLTLLSRDHRGLHDRFAGTRVVRASL